MTVILSADPERTVAIPVVVAANQGGATSADYSGLPASVTFSSGETSKSFTFMATQDTEDDDGESVKLGFGTLPARVSEGTPDETTVHIGDDDDPQVTAEFGADTYAVAEGGTRAVTVTLSADPERTVAIPVVVAANQGGGNLRRLLRRAGERHVQLRRDGEDVHLQRDAGRRGRRRRERAAGLRRHAALEGLDGGPGARPR